MEYGKLAKHFCDAKLPLRVLESNAGFYIGTFEDEGPNMGPCSRESVEYFPTEAAAIAALETGEWTQRPSL